MQRCEICKVNLPGKHSRCPLCQSRLAGEADGSENPYPRLPKTGAALSKVLMVWISFASVCAAAICISLNTVVHPEEWWSLFVILGIACFWMNFAVFLKKRGNLPNSIIWQVVIISISATVWDLLTGYRGWSVDFIFPCLTVAAMLALIFLSLVQKKDIQEYIMYIVSVCFFAAASFTLSLIGLVRIAIPSVVSFSAAVIFLAFLAFFKGKALKNEFRRRLHM